MAENRGRFQAGNRAALKHGGRSSHERRNYGTETAERYARLRAEALSTYPWLASQPVLLKLLVEKQVDVEHYSRIIEANGRTDRRGNPRAVVAWKEKAESALLATLRQVETARTASSRPADPDFDRRAGIRQVFAELGDETAIAWLRSQGLPVPGEPGYPQPPIPVVDRRH